MANWTPDEAESMLSNRINQPHYVKAVINKVVHEFIKEIARLDEENEQLRKDAERYRWLREGVDRRTWDDLAASLPFEFDVIIDTAKAEDGNDG